MAEGSNKLDSPEVEDPPNKQDDMDDEISARMTASYSEISFHSDQGANEQPEKSPGPSRPYDLPSENRKQEKYPLNMDGHVRYEGDMTHYVADDLEFKIKFQVLLRNEVKPLSLEALVLQDPVHLQANSIDKY